MIDPRRVRRRGARARRRAPPRHPIRVPSHVTERVRVMSFGRSGVHAKMCARPLQLHFYYKYLVYWTPQAQVLLGPKVEYLR